MGGCIVWGLRSYTMIVLCYLILFVRPWVVRLNGCVHPSYADAGCITSNLWVIKCLFSKKWHRRGVIVFPIWSTNEPRHTVVDDGKDVNEGLGFEEGHGGDGEKKKGWAKGPPGTPSRMTLWCGKLGWKLSKILYVMPPFTHGYGIICENRDGVPDRLGRWRCRDHRCACLGEVFIFFPNNPPGIEFH
jgi:hypothetical protein